MSSMKRSKSSTDKLSPEVATTTTILGTLSKAIKAGSVWSDKDEFLDVVYWIRQIVGVLIGICWGVIPIKGLIGIILFVAVNLAIVYIYFNVFQHVDEEEYGGISEILKEGLMTSFATFFVTWIIFYSALHIN